MDLRNYLQISDQERKRFEDIFRRYKRLYEDPDNCTPMLLCYVAAEHTRFEDAIADPLVMLKMELNGLRTHLEMQDDRVPSVRVQYGTPQIAAAFGCELYLPPDSPPAASTHVLKEAADVYRLKKPARDAGWYGKLANWTSIWQENLPRGVQIQHPDIQSAFNSAHLIRGNDIFMDFYDHPAEVDALLDLVTDYMVDIIRHTKKTISTDNEWFFDWGAMWKGFARISNCSLQMISPEFYRNHVLERDRRFFKTVGGGRMHYCGLSPAVIDDFFKIPHLTALDVDNITHDFFDLCERTPKKVSLISTGGFDVGSPNFERLASGRWPKKRNIVINFNAKSIEEGKAALARLRKSIP